MFSWSCDRSQEAGLILLAELILLHGSTHLEPDTFTSRSDPASIEKVSTLLFLTVIWLHMQSSGQHFLRPRTCFYVYLNALEVLRTKGLWRKYRSTFRNKHITYVSVEHVVCSPKSDIVDHDLCYCIYSLENQIHFLPLSTEDNMRIKKLLKYLELTTQGRMTI